MAFLGSMWCRVSQLWRRRLCTEGASGCVASSSNGNTLSHDPPSRGTDNVFARISRGLCFLSRSGLAFHLDMDRMCGPYLGQVRFPVSLKTTMSSFPRFVRWITNSRDSRMAPIWAQQGSPCPSFSHVSRAATRDADWTSGVSGQPRLWFERRVFFFGAIPCFHRHAVSKRSRKSTMMTAETGGSSCRYDRPILSPPPSSHPRP